MNQSEAGRASGIPISTISYRVRAHGISPDEAAQLKRGSHPRSIAVKARALGVKASTVRGRMNNKGWTLDEALTRPLFYGCR